MIRVIKVLNPFQAGTERFTVEIEWRDGLMLEDALVVAGLDPVKSVAVIEGRGIPPELAAGVPVVDAVDIIVMPFVGGGGFWRTFAEIGVVVAAIAASVVTAGIGGLGVLAAAGDALAAGAIALAGAAVSVAGNLLISAFMSPTVGSGPDTATYDPAGPKTIASGGTPIPKGYGTMRWGGNVISSYVDAEGKDNYLNVLVSFGWGPAISISDVRINNTPISDYKDAVYQVRLGSNNQTPIPYFNNVYNGYGQAARCNAGSPVVIQGTGTATQGLEVTCQFPTGVFFSNTDGSTRSLSIAYKVEYAVSGSGNWQTPIMPKETHDFITYNPDGSVLGYPGWVVVPTDAGFSAGVVYDHDNSHSASAHTPGDTWSGTQSVTYYNADGSSYTGNIFLQGEWQMCDPSLKQQIVYSWYSGYEIFTDANQATLYHTTKIYNLPANKYDVRVTKYGSAFAGDAIQPREANNPRTGDQVWVHNINEVQYQDLAYPNMILLGVRALATNQLSGNGLNVTALVTHGITSALPADLASFQLDNPAIVAYDAMCADAELYGGGVDPSRLSVPDLVAWANFNNGMVSDGFTGQIRRHVFNGVFEQPNMSLWKALQKIGAMSQCIPVQVGRNYGFIIDAPVTVPAQIFNVGNIKRDSIKDIWMSLDDRANMVEVTFSDAARDYRSDEPCSVMTPEDIQAGVVVQSTRVNLLGCTSRAQAWHWAYRKLLSTKSLTLTRSFDVSVDAVACQVGSVIGVQDDSTQWADGGRIQAGSAASALVVDRSDLTFATGQGWTVSVLHPTVLLGTMTIQTVVGNQLTFTSYLPNARILLCVKPGGAQSATVKYGANTALLANATGFAPGDVIQIYDEDVVDTQIVSAYDGKTITPAAPFLQAPMADAPWVYGKSAGSFPAKMFRVVNIRRKGDFDMTIDGIIYDPSIYSDDTPIITQTLAVPSQAAAVTGLVAKENYAMSNGNSGGQESTISVGWQAGRDTATVELWIAQNDPNQPLSRETLLATVDKATTYTFPAPTGSIVQIRAVGVDGRGTTASWNNAPKVTITVQGSGAAPGDVSGFNGVFTSGTTTFSWAAASSAANYEIRYNADSANTDWNSAVLLWSGSALTWADTTTRNGVYLLKALTSGSVESINAASFSLAHNSSYLNALGLAASQSIQASIATNSYDAGSGLCTVTISWASQSLNRTDGSSVTLPAGSLSWTTLSPSTTYYFYLYVQLSDMSMHSAAGDSLPPDTSPNGIHALFANKDGRAQGPQITVTTPSTSGTGGGSGGLGWCPDGREIVVLMDRGEAMASTVAPGDRILGRDADGRECWRLVSAVKKGRADAWYRVNGYRMSPADPVWFNGEWRMPYEVGVPDVGEGERVAITVESDDYDGHSYYLVGRGEPLLIHNISATC